MTRTRGFAVRSGGQVNERVAFRATGTVEREAAPTTLKRRAGRHRITLGADKAYDVEAFVGELRAGA